MATFRFRPDDFYLHAREPIPALCARYSVSTITVKRWREELGIRVRRGAPAGNQNGSCRTGVTDTGAQIRAGLNCKRPRCSGWCRDVAGAGNKP